MALNSRDFSDIVLMQFAILDIQRYQRAYIKVNNVKGVMVKWKKGWFAVYGKWTGWSFYRPTEFRNMTDRLEARIKAVKE